MSDIFVTKKLGDGTLQIGNSSGVDGNGFIDKENYPTDLVIPEEIGTSRVSIIGKYAFRKCSKIKSIKFPKTIIEIQNYAFDYVYLSIDTFDLSDYKLRTLGRQVFSSNDIKKVILGKEIEKIINCPFTTNRNLDAIIVDKENKYFSNDMQGALYDKKQTRLIEIPLNRKNFTIPETVSIIEDRAFEYVKLSMIVMPSSIKSINGNAFYGCDLLEEIYIYCKLTNKMINMFYGINHEMRVFYMRKGTVNVQLFSQCVKPSISVCSDYKGNFSNYQPVIEESFCFTPKIVTHCQRKVNHSSFLMTCSFLIMSA